jgi:hypothetical protein
MGDGYRPVTDSTGTVEVDGLRQLIRSLRRAGDDLADLKDANQAAATIALRGAESLVAYGTDGARRTEPVWSDTYAKALQAICDTVKGA